MLDETEVFIIVAKQKTLAEEIDNLNRNFGKDSASRKTQRYKEERLQRLSELWSEFDSNHKKIVSTVKKDTPYMQRDTYNRVKSVYEEFKNKLDSLNPIPETLKTTDRDPKNKDNISEVQNQRLKKLKLKVVAIVENLEEFEETFQDYSREIYEYQQKMLLEQLRNITDLHEDFMANASEEDLKEPYVTNNEYKGIKQDINRFLHEMASTISSSNNENRPKHETLLPRLKIPTFKGDYLEWQQFNDLFVNIIHTKTSLSTTEKMEYLKTHLEGEPLHLIKHLTFSSDNYNSAWEILNGRYNNERKIASMHIEKMLKSGHSSTPTATSIKNTLDAIKEGLAALKNMGYDTSSWGPIIVHLTTKSLDTESRNLFEQGLDEPNKMPAMKTLLEYLERRYQALEVMSTNKKQQKPAADESKNIVRNFVINAKPIQCPICNGEHTIYKCTKFLKLSPKERWQQCKQAKLCLNCLKHNKQLQCFSKRNCHHCNKKHHSFLHMDWTEKPKPFVQEEPATSSKQVNHAEQNQNVLIATAMLKVNNDNGRSLTIRALIDPGSQASLITESVVQTLKLNKQNVCVEVSGLGATKAGIAKKKVEVTIMPHFSSKFKLKMEALVLPTLTRQLPSKQTTKQIDLNQLELADPTFNVPGPIDMIIGADIYGDIILSGIKRDTSNYLVAQKSHLGWFVSGRTSNNEPEKYSVTGLVALTSIDEQLEKFWEIEEISQPKYLKPEDKQCEQLFKESHYRKKDGRYVVKIPFNEESTHIKQLGESKNRATARFRQLEFKLNKNPELKADYAEVINEFLNLGHMVEVTSHPSKNNELTNNNIFYMPHHAVIKPSSTTTKLRVVFDGSAKSTTGVSLNQLMLIGPKLQDDITTILTRWRKHKYVFTSDIEKMYRQIELHADHQDYQRILWRSSNNQPIKEYKLTTVTYGTASAPYLAIRTLQQLAEDEQSKYPTAANIVNHDFYVDDVMSGGDTISECRRAQKELDKMLRGAGFQLRKWAANNKRLLEHIPIELRNQQKKDVMKDETIKTLGIHWNPLNDTFQFKVNFDTRISTEILTKRKTLSEIAKLFDPLGWLAPITVSAKILMQRIWQAELDWDESLPVELHKQWNKIKTNLIAVEDIRIPRWIESKKDQQIELHGFCDASEAAYAAVVYARVILPTGFYTSIILTAKTKVAPIRKKLPLPKLELCGAHLLSKLLAETKKTFGLQVGKTFAWTDSTITLAWIKKCPSTWKTFVANRVSEIQETTNVACWRHVRSTDNPADYGSRGCSPEQMTSNKLWWNGPRWLKFDSEKWPSPEQHPSAVIDVPDTRKVLTIEVGEIEDFTKRFSSYWKLIRVAAYCRRFIANCKSKLMNNPIQTGYLTVKELDDGSKGIIRYIQGKVYSEELQCLRDGKIIDKRSKVLSLNPFLNHENILVVGGRLQNAKLSSTEKHPTILPHQEWFTKLLVEDAHERTLHGGIRLTIAKLRQRYWIIQVKRCVRQVIHKCIRCFRFAAQPRTQQMGLLPAARVTPSRPFTHTGVDYAGPVQILISKGRGNRSTKGYIAIFICFATKAVHIELVSDLSSAAFIAALKRFTSRRGICSHFYSDNGTTFVGANKEIQQQMRETIKRCEEGASLKLAKDEMQWHFIPPASPHFGGLWESGVKSTKFHLKRIIGETMLTFEELSTLLTQIEACLNSRPLTAIENDVDDTTILTPGHFLIGSSLNAVPESIIDEKRTFRSRWQLIQKITQDFWKVWSSEYLSQLQQLPKWKQKRENMKIGDIVLIKEDRLPPTTWMMGKISDVHPGKDNGVRAATVYSNNKHFKRPITKLCKLPIENNEQENEVRQVNTSTNSLHQVFWLCILFGLLNIAGSTPIPHDVEIVPFQNHPGIYFEDVGQANLISSSWKTIVFFNLTNYWQEFETYKKLVSQMEKSCSSSEVRESKSIMCEGLLHQFQYQIQQIQLNNEILLHANEDSTRRQRRSPFDFIGTITNELFGILDQRFAKSYEQTIEAVKENEQHLLQLMKNQTTIVDSTVNIFKKEQIENAKQIQLLSSIVSKLEDETGKYENMKIFSSNALNAILIMINFKGTQSILLDILLSTHTGRIHPLILSVQQFKDELTKIHENIPKSLMIPGERHHESILQLYKILSARARVTDNNIIIEISLPLLYNEEFKLYRVLPVPTEHNGNFTSIIPSSEYLMVNLQVNHFYPLNKDEFSKCKMRPSEIIWCTLQHPLYTTGASVSVCEMNIIQHKQTMDSCTTKDIPPRLYWIEMYQQNSWIYSTPALVTVNINCDFNTVPVTLRGSGMLKLPARCIIHDQTMTIVGKQTMTSRLKSSFLPSFNLSDQLTLFNFKREQQSVLPNNASLDISTLEDSIRLQKRQENILNEISTHRIHQYSLLGVNGFMIIGVIIFIILIVRRKVAQQPTPSITPTSIPMRSSNKPMRSFNKRRNTQTSFEDIDFCVSSI